MKLMKQRKAYMNNCRIQRNRRKTSKEMILTKAPSTSSKAQKITKCLIPMDRIINLESTI